MTDSRTTGSTGGTSGGNPGQGNLIAPVYLWVAGLQGWRALASPEADAEPPTQRSWDDEPRGRNRRRRRRGPRRNVDSGALPPVSGASADTGSISVAMMSSGTGGEVLSRYQMRETPARHDTRAAVPPYSQLARCSGGPR